MKKLILGAIISSFLLVGCQAEEKIVDDNDGAEDIGYNVPESENISDVELHSTEADEKQQLEGEEAADRASDVLGDMQETLNEMADDAGNVVADTVDTINKGAKETADDISSSIKKGIKETEKDLKKSLENLKQPTDEATSGSEAETSTDANEPSESQGEETEDDLSRIDL